VRICSLVPAATEVLFGLGLGEQVVGVTHECDWPPEAESRPAVTVSLIDTDSLTSAEIDRAVAAVARRGEPLYAIAEEEWAEVQADVVVAQEVCDVCAVSAGTARALEVEVVDYSPVSLGGIADAIVGLGTRLGAAEVAVELAASMRARLELVHGQVEELENRPRVFVAEWLDPPYAAGHWVPEMVAAAGGKEVLGRPGAPSFRTTWAEVGALEPEVVVLAPCGYDLARTQAESAAVAEPLLAERDVVAVDANAHFSRPGPRVADGVELLAHVLHPKAVPDPGFAFARL
jgi:iron complex transport system substrate-binding protein